MDCTTNYLSYEQTGYFSSIITDYLKGHEMLRPFYANEVSLAGIRKNIEQRGDHITDRKLLVEVLRKQYADVSVTDVIHSNIESLLKENTFTVCTAHQPNIFTGHLYFIYKVLHAIKLSEWLTHNLPGFLFIPVFYMGSEDADLEELGHIYLFGKKYEWETGQTGAVGRMKVDKALVQLIGDISGQLLVYPFGEEIISLLKVCYLEGTTIEQSGFKLINALFAKYGLLVLLPDNQELKKAFIPVIKKELIEEFSTKEVAKTVANFPASYKVQAGGRELNLFYLTDDNRNRIIREHSAFNIQHSSLTFSNENIQTEITLHPERFSPNVILRPVFQEMILPNLVFIGGGGEIAYWLELKKVFEAVQVPFPVMILRNSFLVIEKERKKARVKLKLEIKDLFKKETDLLNALVKRESILQLSLDKEKKALGNLYNQMKNISGIVDPTLSVHTEALKAKAMHKIESLEKKLLKAERKKFEASQRQLHKLLDQLFPQGNLQERIDNILPYYARFGKAFIEKIYENSLPLEQKFCIIEEI